MSLSLSVSEPIRRRRQVSAAHSELAAGQTEVENRHSQLKEVGGTVSMSLSVSLVSTGVTWKLKLTTRAGAGGSAGRRGQPHLAVAEHEQQHAAREQCAMSMTMTERWKTQGLVHPRLRSKRPLSRNRIRIKFK